MVLDLFIIYFNLSRGLLGSTFHCMKLILVDVIDALKPYSICQKPVVRFFWKNTGRKGIIRPYSFIDLGQEK
jgi:hypothetical protein